MNNKAIAVILAVIMASVSFCIIADTIDAETDDASELGSLINDSTTSIVNLERDYNISGTVTINRNVTVNGNGHSITYSGTGSAIDIKSSSVVMNGLRINAETSGAYAISITSNTPDVTVQNCIIKANNQGIHMYPEDGCTGATLKISGTEICNSRITDYDDSTTTGDTRGIALYGVENSQIKIMNNSKILGFGYSVNMSNDVIGGVRAGGNTYTVEDSTIIGWSAFNVWTVGNTFNITSSTLKGISNLNTDWNNFATIVINNGIYNGNVGASNIINVKGGEISAYAQGTAMHACILESAEKRTQITFMMNGGDYVKLKFDSSLETPFAVSAPASSIDVNGIQYTEWIYL